MEEDRCPFIYCLMTRSNCMDLFIRSNWKKHYLHTSMAAQNVNSDCNCLKGLDFLYIYIYNTNYDHKAVNDHITLYYMASSWEEGGKKTTNTHTLILRNMGQTYWCKNQCKCNINWTQLYSPLIGWSMLVSILWLFSLSDTSSPSPILKVTVRSSTAREGIGTDTMSIMGTLVCAAIPLPSGSFTSWSGFKIWLWSLFFSISGDSEGLDLISPVGRPEGMIKPLRHFKPINFKRAAS